jgi:uncharacterized protein (DUF2236 family)
MMPSREEAAELVPERGGVTWRIVGDARLFAGSAYTPLLQVMYPAVGAGVSEHSNFKGDPWGRLLRTLDYTSAVVYGGPDLAWEVGRRVRELHKSIRGRRADGGRYHALAPGPYAWVHASLAESIVRGRHLYCGSLTREEIELFWSEWRRMGRLIGVRYEDLPESWAELVRYFEQIVERELEDTEAAQDVLLALREPAAPPLPAMPASVWRVLRWPPTRAARLATIGMLSPVLRERLGLAWGASSELRFQTLARMIRASRPLMPAQARSFGPHYLRWRRGSGSAAEGRSADATRTRTESGRSSSGGSRTSRRAPARGVGDLEVDDGIDAFDLSGLDVVCHPGEDLVEHQLPPVRIRHALRQLLVRDLPDHRGELRRVGPADPVQRRPACFLGRHTYLPDSLSTTVPTAP